MKSMTGYGMAHYKGKKWQIDVTAKSVNGRFLEIRTHLPKEYSPFENEIKALVAKFFKRGTINLYFNRLLFIHKESFVVDANVAQSWIVAYKQLGKKLKLEHEINLGELIKILPEALTTSTETQVSEAEKKKVLQVLKEALIHLGKERSREGLALKNEILHQLDELNTCHSIIEKLSGALAKNIQEGMLNRLGDLISNGNMDPQRVAQEVAILVDRQDIREEVARLKEHIKAFRSLCQNNQPLGRKLDFYTQELLREINTVGSKSQQTKLTQTVVDAKSIVERIKEQVQNIE